MTSALANQTRVAWTYTDDDSVSYIIAANAALMATSGNDAKLGGSAALETLQEIPNELKPRMVKCVDAAAHGKYVICYDTTATLWTTPGTAIQLNYHGVDTAFKSTKTKRRESLGRVGKNPVASA